MNYYKKLMKLIVIGFVFCLVSGQIFAQNISVIVAAKSSHNPDKAEVVNIFSAKQTSWGDGNEIQVVDQAKTETGSAFYKNCLKTNPNKVLIGWTKLVLSGQANAPVKCSDDAAVKAAVAGNSNAIGYVLSSSIDGTVKELFKITQ